MQENENKVSKLDTPKIGKKSSKEEILNLYGSYDSEFLPAKYFINEYKELCRTYAAFASINLEHFLTKLNEKYSLTEEDYILKQEQSKDKKINEPDFNASSYFIKLKDKLLLEVSPYRATFFYSSSIAFSDVEEVLSLVKESKKKKKHKRKFYMITANTRSEYGFEFRKFNIKKTAEKIVAGHYNDDFNEAHNAINGFLKKDNTQGLVLLHGKYGTGKTSYIRSLMNTVNRRFIFLPLDLMDAISAPNFLPFISKYKNSILILEDAENLLKPRNSGQQQGNSLVNLLNLGDGLLSDALSLKIICTFNADLKQIDQAILRKGRLVARYEFKELGVEKAQAIADEIGLKDKITSPATLADIYNKDKNDFGKPQGGKVGFGLKK